MSEITEITIYNVYDFVTYSFNESRREFIISWDSLNTEVENIMKCEKIPYDKDVKYSAVWINELKKCVGWEKGMELQLASRYSYRSDRSGIFIITVLKQFYDGQIYEFIDKDGYFRVRQYTTKAVISTQGKNSRQMELCNCLYNDNLQ